MGHEPHSISILRLVIFTFLVLTGGLCEGNYGDTPLNSKPTLKPNGDFR